MKIVQAFSLWPFNGEFGGTGVPEPTVYTVEFPFPPLVSGPRVMGIITAKEAVVDMPALGSMKRGFRLEYGTSSGKSKGRGWVQGTAPLGNRRVDGVCYHYELNVPADRERAEQAAATSLETEYALALADAQATQSLRTDGVDVAKPYEPMVPPEKPPFKRLTKREREAHPINTLHTPAVAQAIADGMNEKRAEEERETNAAFVIEAEAAIKEQAEEQARRERNIKMKFVTAQTEGIRANLQELGCPLHIAVMIVKGIFFTTKQRDPAMLGQWAYIAGPMRGKPDFNFPAFDEARNVLLHEGINVISPADIDRGDQGPPDPIERTRLYVMRDFWTLMLLSSWSSEPNPQFICFLDGWEDSVGAAAEGFLARWLSLQAIVVDAKLLTPITQRPWPNMVRSFARLTV